MATNRVSLMCEEHLWEELRLLGEGEESHSAYRSGVIRSLVNSIITAHGENRLFEGLSEGIKLSLEVGEGSKKLRKTFHCDPEKWEALVKLGENNGGASYLIRMAIYKLRSQRLKRFTCYNPVDD